MSGFLLINKPAGITSFGVVSRIKRLTGEKRVGHTGTLDPMATGVLPVFIGNATCLSSFLLDADKAYTGRAKLGVLTDTLDITGQVLKQETVNVSIDDVKSAAAGFLGEIKQTPPMFSALKKNGVPLYKLARNGETAEIPERDVTIYSFDITSDLAQDEFDFKAVVSKGTYIRSLVRDLGERLGSSATLTSLCRIKTAGFSIENCVDLDLLTNENIGEYIKSPDSAIEHIERLDVTERQGIRFSNGGQLALDRLHLTDTQNGKLYRVYSCGKFHGIGFVDAPNEQLAIKCVLK